jgi:hypothetical protein
MIVAGVVFVPAVFSIACVVAALIKAYTPFKPDYPGEPNFEKLSWVAPAFFAVVGSVIAIAAGLIVSGSMLRRHEKAPDDPHLKEK